MPRGTGRPDTRSERESRDRSRDDRGGIRDRDLGRSAAQRATAGRSGRDNTASFREFNRMHSGLPATEPSESELNALSLAIDEYDARDNFMSDLFGLNHNIEVNPRTGEYDVAVSKTVSPLGMVAGVLGGPLGSLAGLALSQFDPLSFDVGLGFVGDPAEEGQTETAKSQRDDKRSESVASVGDATNLPEREFDSQLTQAIDGLLNQLQFEVFEMPDFRLLDPNFGEDIQSIDLAELLSRVQGDRSTG